MKLAIALALVAATHGFVPYVRHARSPVRMSPSDARSAARGAAPAAVAAEPSHDVAAPSDAVSPAQLCFRLRNGALMPAIGLGTWKGAPGTAEAAVEEALAAGYRHIDCAQMYGNQHEVGAAFARAFAPDGLGLRREDVFVTSKIMMGDSPRLAGAGPQGHHPRDFEAQCRATLADLRLEYVDLYVIHWPIEGELGDGDTLEAAWAAMERIVDLGLAKAIGVSNFSPKKLDRVLAVARVAPAVNQVEAHPAWRNDAVVEHAARHGVHVTAYSPLGSPDQFTPADAGGLGRTQCGAIPLYDARATEAASLAAASGGDAVSSAQALLRWGVQRGTSVLPKSTKPERLRENLAPALAACPWALDAPAMAVLDGWQEQYRLGPGAIHTGPNRNHKTLAALWDEDVAWARGLAFDTRDGFKLE